MRISLIQKLFYISSFTAVFAQNLFAQNGVGVNTLTPMSSFEDNGSFGKKVSTITASTTLDATYGSVVCNTNAFTVTLPVATGCAFRVYEIKRAIGNTNIITINVTTGGTIDGATTYLLSNAGQSVTVFSDGSAWLLRDGSGEGANWSLKGNAGTVPATNFLGTTDAQDLVIRTSNSEYARITSGGLFGVGTPAPQQNLTVFNGMNIDQAGSNNGNMTNSLRFGSFSGEAIGSKRSAGGNNPSGIDFYTNFANRMVVTNTGNVGVGAVAPEQNLSVWNGMNIDQGSSNIGSVVNSLSFGSFSGEAIGSKRSAGGNQYGIDFYTGSLNRMVVTSGGYVGVGTTNPSKGKITMTTSNPFGGVDDDLAITSHGINGQPAMVFYRSRGTELSPIDVNNGDMLFQVIAFPYTSGSYSATSGIIATKKGGSTDVLSDLTFQTSFQACGKFNEFGQFGIGYTSFNNAVNALSLLHLYEQGLGSAPSATSGTLRLEHAAAGGQNSILFKSSQNAADFGYIGYSDNGSGNGTALDNSLLTISVGNGGPGANQDDIALMPSGFVGIGTITPTSLLSVNGTASKVGGGVWAAFSDKRLKKDIVDFTDGLDKLMKIHAVKFKYNGKGPYTDSTSEFIGVIAQEIQQIVPYTVSGFKMKLNPSDKVETELLKFDGSSLQYMLINSVKELKNEVDALKKEIETLKKNK